MRTHLGQNFLKDPAISARIVEAAGILPTDTVVEIGPGRGALTSFIVPRAARTIAVELDKKLLSALAAKFPTAVIIGADALETDFGAIYDGQPAVFIGNLPYCSATAILAKIIPGKFWKRAVFMFQKEVARRITAIPGTAGRAKEPGYLTAFARYYSRPEILFDVKPGSFNPPPKITSSVVAFEPSSVEERFADERMEKIFFRVVAAAFSKRRKTMANALSSLAGMDKNKILRALETAGIEPSARAETLDIKAFKKLALAML